MLVDIGNEDPEWGAVEEEMQSTIRFDIHVFFIISWGGIFIIRNTWALKDTRLLRTVC